MRRYLETFLRHRLLLLVPLVLALVTGLAAVTVQPKQYQASAKILFYGSSGDVAPAGSPYSYMSPAEQQMGALKELITSRSFCSKVGNRGPLALYLTGGTPAGGGVGGFMTKIIQRLGLAAPTGATPDQVDSLTYDMLNRTVTVIATPPQLVTVTFSAADPQVAAGTVQALVDQFSAETLETRRVQAQAVVTFFEQQVAEQDKQGATAESAVTKYLQAHPGLKVADTALTSLRRTADLAHQRYDGLLLELDQARLDLAAQSQPGGAGFRVIDPPVPPTQPVGQTMAAVRTVAGALAAGLLLTVLSILALTAADTTLRRPEDVTSALGLRPAGTIPRVA